MAETGKDNIICPSTLAIAASNIPSTFIESPSRDNKIQLTPLRNKIIEEIDTEEIRVDMENGLGQEYFKPDPVEGPEPNVNQLIWQLHHKKDDSPYETYFKLGVFLKFFLMHLLFFCLLGPLMIVTAPIFGTHVLRNQDFFGFTRGFFVQAVQFLFIISFFLVYYLTETPGLQGIEVFMVIVAVLIRMIIISSKYAHQSEWLLNLLETTTLSQLDRASDLMANRWRLQTDDLIEEEIQSAILRLEIDSSFFFFNFVCNIDTDLRNKLIKNVKAENNQQEGLQVQDSHDEVTIPIVKIEEKERTTYKMRNIIEKHKKGAFKEILASRTNGNISNKSIPLTSPRGDMSKAFRGKSFDISLLGQGTQKIFNTFLDFFRPQALETKYLYGYNLLVDLIKNAKQARSRNLIKIALFISVIRAMLPTLYRVYLINVKNEDIQVFSEKSYLVVIIFITNVMFFWFNCILLVVPVLDMHSKVYCFKQIGYLIAPKKIAYFQERKLYPTLNIFDPVTLKTWSNIRKIMRDYGKKYSQRSDLNIGLTMIFYSFILVTFVLQMLGVFTAFADPLILIIFAFESLVFFLIFVSIMIGSAFLNNQYKVHKNLLKSVKTILADFQRLSYLYVGRDAIKPDNYLYQEGLKLFQKEFGDEDFETKLVERAEKLTGMIDDIIEELDFEELNEPFKVMGVTIDYNLLGSLGLGGVSLLFAMGQSWVNK